jgi:uncharacterized protein
LNEFSYFSIFILRIIMIHKSFPKEIHTDLGNYVYVYVDTSFEEEQISYVGKGKDNRCFTHLISTAGDDKTLRIEELKKSNELRIDLLAFGLDEETALKVEAAAIDLLCLDNLTNKQSGHRSAELGRIPIDDLIARRTFSEIEQFRDDCILIRINQRYKVGMSALELYESTRGVWRIGANRDIVKYALAIYQGVVQEVYHIQAWFQAGSTFYGTRQPDAVTNEDRWEFVGNIAEDTIRKRYIYKSLGERLPDGAQNPIAYFGPSFNK